MTREEAIKKLDKQALVLWKNHPMMLEIFRTRVRPKLWELLIGDERLCLALETASDDHVQELLKYHYTTCGEQVSSELLARGRGAVPNVPRTVPVPVKKRSKLKWFFFGVFGIFVLLIVGAVYIVTEKPVWFYDVEDTVSSIVDKAQKASKSKAPSDKEKKPVVLAAEQTSAPLSPKERMDVFEGRVKAMEDEMTSTQNPWDVLALRAKYISTDAAQKLDDEISEEVKGDALEYLDIYDTKEKEISDLESEIDNKLDTIAKNYVCPLITGEVRDRFDDGTILVWGECNWGGRTPPAGPFGMGNIVVRNPIAGGVIYGSSYQSLKHYYVSRTTAENAFRGMVNVYIFDSVEPLVDATVGFDEQRLEQMKTDLREDKYLIGLQIEIDRAKVLSARLMTVLSAYRMPSKKLFNDLQNYAQLPTDAGSREQYKKLVAALEGNSVGADGMTWKFNYSELTTGSLCSEKIEVQDGTMYVDPRRNLALIFRYYEQMLDSVLHVVSPKILKDYCDNPMFQNTLARMADTQTSFPVDMPLHTHIAKDVLKQAGWRLVGPYYPSDEIGELVWYELSPIGQLGVPTDQADYIKVFGDFNKLKAAPHFYVVPGGVTVERPDVRPWQLVETPEDKAAALAKYTNVVTERCPKIWSGWMFKVDYISPGDKIGLIYPQGKFGGAGVTICSLKELNDADASVLGEIHTGDWVLVDAVQMPDEIGSGEESITSVMSLTGIEKITVDEKNLKFWDSMRCNSYYLMCRTDGIRMMLLAVTPRVFAERFMTFPKNK